MSVELRFEVKLESDWHINAGFGDGASVDAVIERDSDGIPIISGSTLKGLFRDALYDLYKIISHNGTASHFNVPQDNPCDILGSAQAESRWVVEHARPKQYAQVQAGHATVGQDMSMIATGVRVDPQTRRAEDNKFFTKELGQADTFVFTLHCLSEDAGEQQGDARWLVAAASYIRRLGSRRRRGTGRCRITLVNDHQQILNNFGASVCNIGSQSTIDLPAIKRPAFTTPQAVTTQRFRIWIHSQRPIVVSSRAEAGNNYEGRDIIPGRTLRGALAWQVSKSDRATGLFRNYFVNGGAYFSNLYPVTQGGHVITASPMGLQKYPDGSPLSAIVSDKRIKSKKYDKHHILANGYPPLDPNQRSRLSKQTHMHVKINPDTKRANDGDLYSYQAPPSGVQYVGEIVLQSGDWSEFANLIRKNINQVFTLRMGKARNKSYGKCHVWIEPITDISTPPVWMPIPLETRLQSDITQREGLITLTLASDAVIQDTWGRFIGKFDNAWLQAHLPHVLSVADDKLAFARSQVLHGFNMQSGLPQWRDVIMLSGSSVAFNVEGDIDIEELKKIEVNGIGLRRSEGFGRIVFNHPAHSGITEGFQTNAIPISLATQEQSKKLSAQLRDEWIAQLAKSTLQIDERYRSPLARKLVESGRDFSSAHAILNVFVEEQKPEHGLNSSKSSDLDLNIINTLLEVLNNDYDPSFWHKGLVLLAEHLLNGGD